MSSFYKLISISLAVVGLLLTGVQAQCLNEVAAYNPNARTMSENLTAFLVPVSSTAVQQALDLSYGKSVTGASNVQLLPVPSSDKSLFPQGFPSDLHPVIATAGFADDIRMSIAQINGALLVGQIFVPFVRRFDSQPGTVLQAQLNGYMAGPGNSQVAGLVPSQVSTVIEGYQLRLGQFSPDSAAYMLNGNILSNKVAWAVAPNAVSGPGVYIESSDFEYIRGTLKTTTIKLFRYVSNQPAILSGSVGTLGQLCQRNQFYYNNDTSTMIPRVGNVTFGAAADGAGITNGVLQGASPGRVYYKVEGFSACGQNVGYNPENCDAAARNVDKSAL